MTSTDKTGRSAISLRTLLLCLALLFLVPAAYAHDAGHHHQDGVRATQARAPAQAMLGQPCGGSGDAYCLCDHNCCDAPNAEKLPAIAQVRSAPDAASEPPARPFARIQVHPSTSPILAYAAPRAPPLSL